MREQGSLETVKNAGAKAIRGMEATIRVMASYAANIMYMQKKFEAFYENCLENPEVVKSDFNHYNDAGDLTKLLNHNNTKERTRR